MRALPWPLRWTFHRYLDLCRAVPWLTVPVRHRYGGEAFRLHPRFVRSGFPEEDPVLRALAHTLRPGDTFFDVGANFGFLTTFAARRVGPEGRVYSFEPSEKNGHYLRYHVRANDLGNVVVSPSAVVGRDVETVTFFLLDGGESASNSTTFGDVPDAPYVGGRTSETVVPATTLDAAVARHGARPTLVKIDVEGAELDVLRGAAETLRVHRPHLLVGVHPFWMPAGDTPEALHALLRAAGYRLYALEDGGEPETLGYGDYLCLPDGAAPPPGALGRA